jgi:hypothetical protein
MSPRIALLLLAAALLGSACSTFTPPPSSFNRPDGEGYAGRGELVLRIGLTATGGSPFYVDGISQKRPERGLVELRYLGLDATGRAVFQRHDADSLAGAPIAVKDPAAPVETELKYTPDSDTPNTRQIVMDLRLTRQLHIQGKTIEVVEASPTGLVFRLY